MERWFHMRPNQNLPSYPSICLMLKSTELFSVPEANAGAIQTTLGLELTPEPVKIPPGGSRVQRGRGRDREADGRFS